MSDLKQKKRTLEGRVVSNKMDKTITVLVERRVQHPVYGKFVRKTSKIHAHDAKNECKQGDLVIIVEGRPISKNKAWSLVEIVEHATEI